MSQPLPSHLARFGFAALGLCAALVAAPAAQAQALIRDVEIEDTLRAYDTPVLRAAGINPDDVRFLIVNDPTINAYVSGGQNIFVHTGLLIAAKTPNEIIGVMAHETGHIAGGHLARSGPAQDIAMRPMLISIGLGILAMAAGAPAAGAALIAGSQQFAMGDYVRFTQGEEASADQAAVTFLENSGQSGRGLIDFFNRELRPYEFMTRHIPAWAQTHPFSSDRVEALRLRVESAEHYNAPDTDDNIRRFHFMQAKLIGFIQTRGQTLARYPLSDTSEYARYARAIAYYRDSDTDAAIAELNTLITAEPNNPYFQELMGQILFESQRAPQAVPYYRHSLAQNPHSALFQINLARALDGVGRDDTDESLTLLTSATATEPDNGFAWREMAAAYDLRHNEGLADYASAEASFAVLDCATAINFSERSRRLMPSGSPSYLRASDISRICDDALREQMGHGGSVTPTGGGSGRRH